MLARTARRRLILGEKKRTYRVFTPEQKTEIVLAGIRAADRFATYAANTRSPRPSTTGDGSWGCAAFAFDGEGAVVERADPVGRDPLDD
ncbi:MAG: hypothetical protein QOE83_37 [Actinomycetota bacterium]|jgi:hypothetical protein|nr:hypothetical protein [Actinomycetota bacterium]